ncbi:cytoplasmic polyadenylation element-binding protein 1-like [Xyrauchen texanus]|uniref:cytoplasmic polyadenylation element-binding protein 1-like n=1 Tax=Xyrauchen texanus TaxID=154827 RepID=UPI002242A627|nr:cytoplasmic polyadenylation element-binding protein 1-like [Xyrauchen texanus]
MTDGSGTGSSPLVRMLFAPEQQDSPSGVPSVEELSLGPPQTCSQTPNGSGTGSSPLVRMLFAPEQQDSPSSVPSVEELSLGLLSLSLPSWNQPPWIHPEPQRPPQTCSQTPNGSGTGSSPLVRMLFAPPPWIHPEPQRPPQTCSQTPRKSLLCTTEETSGFETGTMTDGSGTGSSPLVRMLFAPEQQDSPSSVPSVEELSLGLLSLSLPSWNQPPWIHPEPQRPPQTCSQTPSSDPGQNQGFQAQESAGGHDLPKASHVIPKREPVNSETSGISSGSDQLVSFRVSPPLPLLLPGWDALGLNKPSVCIEREAKLHKQAAAVNEATYNWEGRLPHRHYKYPVYSCKVFLGGVPWDITEASLLNTFSVFGSLKVDWPGKDGRHPHSPSGGYVYLLFNCEKSVKALLQACIQHHLQSDDYLEFYYKLSSRRIYKDVQVIPWVISDNNFSRYPTQHLYNNKMVFVGALHGMITAEALAHIMDDLFGYVLFVGIDTDKHKYPIGSGRVTFRSQRSYFKAVTAAFVQIKTSKFTRKVQIDPYLDDSLCQMCSSQPGPFFCRAQACFKYYCRACWHWRHSVEVLSSHRPLMKNCAKMCVHEKEKASLREVAGRETAT